ncbi:MAG: hypothetical protein SO424_08325 [[Pasteurella] aerogenes]|nr:hypothetical protein [[Pasteurella] aerogenes]
MKLLISLSCILCVTSCSFGGFQPPRPYDVWFFKDPDPDILNRREKDMRACGMDPVVGESDYPKANLCLEKKGWYLEGGPVCENELMWNRPLCIEWRAKHSKPDAKPWGKRK